MGPGQRHRRGLHLRPGDLGDPADLLSDGHGLLDHEVHADHVRQHSVLLGAEHVVDLLVDRGEIVGDLIHGLLHRKLRHEPGSTSQNRRVGQKRSRPLHEFDESFDLAVVPLQHTGAETRLRVFPQPVLLDKLRGLLSQLHPAT